LIKIEKRIQLAFKELLIEETWNYLKTLNNYERVLSIATLIDKYDPKPDPCYEDCSGMCFGCYDGYTFSLDWRDGSNLRSKKPFSELTTHERVMLREAIDDKIHECDQWCSKFICYKYTGETCQITHCHNLYIKKQKNLKYCSLCRAIPGTMYHQNYNCNEDCYCKKSVIESL
jgi:hypothetical protein